ncbi:hypothetical protein SAY86_021836 [Trapa natans]|uniref:WRKY domain-containing protein n=1 Tax=Trapa natans TaxID=22666 RepID=A0AAN7RDC1_TRANT|nr:hypothetical protein SAY86_021836 [Trapa natans]
MAEKQEARKPPRPTITLPPRPSMDNFAGFTSSPGPLSLVSSFLSDNPFESSPDFWSFSQLLAGAMNSPLAVMASVQTPPLRVGDNPSGAPSMEAKSGDGAEKNSGFKQNRPMGLAVVRSPFFTVPPGLSPSELLYSPGLLSCQSSFGMSHQQALAQVTAQATLTQSHISMLPNSQPANLESESLFTQEPPSVPTEAIQQTQASAPSLVSSGAFAEASDITNSSVRTESLPIPVDKPAEDGYNWRKYGQKQVKGCEYPRSYYKCTHPNCPTKKIVERSLDGRITEIVYKGYHNHDVPQPSRRSKEANGLSGSTQSNAKPEVDPHRPMGTLNQIESAQAMPIRDQEFTQAITTMQTSGSINNEEVNDAGTITIGDDDEPHPKRRNLEAASSAAPRTVAEGKIVLQTRSEVDLLDDGYRWRKYGQKVVKGNPHPRSYYKCTFAGCNVRKHVERAAADPKAVITTYEGKHNHSVPGARGSSHTTANPNQVSGLNSRTVEAQYHALHDGVGYGNNQQPALLRLKEEKVAS